MGAREHDAGFATVWTAVVVTVLVGLTVVGVQLATAVLTRHRAEAAADLAALAAAGTPLRTQACAHARDVAERNGAVLSSCRLASRDVLVRVEVALPGGSLTGSAHAKARAGPVMPSGLFPADR